MTPVTFTDDLDLVLVVAKERELTQRGNHAITMVKSWGINNGLELEEVSHVVVIKDWWEEVGSHSICD